MIIVQLFMSQGWLSELGVPGLLMDLRAIGLWHLKPESKADLSLTIFLLKKNPFCLSPHYYRRFWRGCRHVWWR